MRGQLCTVTMYCIYFTINPSLGFAPCMYVQCTMYNVQYNNTCLPRVHFSGWLCFPAFARRHAWKILFLNEGGRSHLVNLYVCNVCNVCNVCHVLYCTMIEFASSPLYPIGIPALAQAHHSSCLFICLFVCFLVIRGAFVRNT